jgi:hypothetical protein
MWRIGNITARDSGIYAAEAAWVTLVALDSSLFAGDASISRFMLTRSFALDC